MENLSEKVYECTLAVEAHMVCDLLSQAGISARVDGEFLQSAMGEIPLGNAVKVRVDPARAAEAREVIADWEKQQPVDPIAVPVTKTPRFKAPLWFFIGTMVGAAAALIVVFARARDGSGVDYDGDGRNDLNFYYWGSNPSVTEVDRNLDGKVDARWNFDLNGYEKNYESDDDFDGYFEWQDDMHRGQVVRSVLDADGDGRPEQVGHFRFGVLMSIDYHFASGGRIVKREFYKAGRLDSAEFDDDGDQVFERRVQYDAHGEPKL